MTLSSILERLLLCLLIDASIGWYIIMTLVPLGHLTLDFERTKLRARLIKFILRNGYNAAILTCFLEVTFTFFVCFVMLAPFLVYFSEISNLIHILWVVPAQTMDAVIFFVGVLEQLIVALGWLASITQPSHIYCNFTLELRKVSMDLHCSAPSVFSFRNYRFLDFQLWVSVTKFHRAILFVLVLCTILREDSAYLSCHQHLLLLSLSNLELLVPCHHILSIKLRFVQLLALLHSQFLFLALLEDGVIRVESCAHAL